MAARTPTARLWALAGANLALVGALAGVGVVAHSVGVLAEGVDYLADAAGIGVSIMAIHLSARPPTPRRPQGYVKVSHYAAGLNAGALLLVTLLVAAGAADRLANREAHVHGLPVLVASGVAAVVMTAGAVFLGADIDDDDGADEDEKQEEGGGRQPDLNRRAVLLDTAADAAAAAGVAAAGAVIFATRGNYWLDPMVALVISAVVAYHAWKLLRRVRRALQASPASVG